nr:glutaminase a [Quercus suber]
MAQIANRTGHTADAANYTAIAHSYITQWQQLGINTAANPPHTTLSYGNASSSGLLYNLWADAALSLHLVPQSVYDMQSTFYPTVLNTYGVPLDTRHTLTKADWAVFAAALTQPDTKQTLIGSIAKWLASTSTSLSFSDKYDTITGEAFCTASCAPGPGDLGRGEFQGCVVLDIVSSVPVVGFPTGFLLGSLVSHSLYVYTGHEPLKFSTVGQIFKVEFAVASRSPLAPPPGIALSFSYPMLRSPCHQHRASASPASFATRAAWCCDGEAHSDGRGRETRYGIAVKL